MKEGWRGPLVVLITLLATILIVLYKTLTSEGMGEYVREQLIAVARRQGVPIRIDRAISCRILSCRAEALSIVIPKAFSYVRLDELVVSPRLWSLFFNAPQIVLHGKVYGGEISGDVTHFRKDNALVVSLRGSGLQASEVPQLSNTGVGITGGSVDFILENLRIEKGGVRFGSSSFAISNGTKPQKTSLSTMMTGLPIPIDIPAINNFNVRLAAGMADGKLHLSEGAVTSSLGAFSTRGDIVFSSKGGAMGFALLGHVEFSEEGMREIPNYPLITASLNPSGGSMPRRFEYALDGNSASPQFTTKPLP